MMAALPKWSHMLDEGAIRSLGDRGKSETAAAKVGANDIVDGK